MERFEEIGSKTGLTAKEVRRVTRFGALGFLALVLASLSACFKAGKTAPAAAEAKPLTLQDLAEPVKEAPPAAGEKPAAPAAAEKKAADKNCGPYPGYPCGTRYYTVSRADLVRPA